MPSFKYVAYDKHGKKRKGTIEAQSRDMAILVLTKNSIYPDKMENISSKNSKIAERVSNLYTRRASKSILSDLFFQLATLINTGIPLTLSLQITAEQPTNRQIKNILLDIKDRINEGEKLSSAIQKHTSLFSKDYIKMIEIAEKTGNLADILFKIADREEEKNYFNQKIMPVIAYPLFVLTLGMGIVGFLLAYVVPKMEKIFSSFHHKLPLLTRILIATGVFIKQYFFAITLFSILVFVAIEILYKKNSSFKSFIDKILLKIPIYRKITIARFVSTLTFQLNADIKLTDAIINSANVVNNTIFTKKLEATAEKINNGAPIDEAFEQTHLFDSMFIATLSTGARAGNLPLFIQRISNYYDKKLSTTLKTTIALIEPITILLLGLIVGFIVMSVMIPLFNINQLVK